MTLWERAVLNMQKGGKKLAVTAATFADRIKAEIAIVRLRVRIEEARSRADEQYRAIGKKIVDLYKKDFFEKATDQALREEGVLAAMVELDDRLREIDELNGEIRNVQSDMESTVKHAEDTIV